MPLVALALLVRWLRRPRTPDPRLHELEARVAELESERQANGRR
ncbi:MULTISPECIES: hypothetical protein [Deinococcus]|nr:hypothetical protein [Deinococcus radiodurans]